MKKMKIPNKKRTKKIKTVKNFSKNSNNNNSNNNKSKNKKSSKNLYQQYLTMTLKNIFQLKSSEKFGKIIKNLCSKRIC